MQYGKLTVDGLIIFAGKSVRYNGRIYVNPTDETLRQIGYKPVVYADMPEDGSYTVVYTEDGDNIYVDYVEQEEITESENTEEAEETEGVEDVGSDE